MCALYLERETQKILISQFGEFHNKICFKIYLCKSEERITWAWEGRQKSSWMEKPWRVRKGATETVWGSGGKTCESMKTDCWAGLDISWWAIPQNTLHVKCESEVAQSCPTLFDPMDGIPPGSSIHGIFQARILEWVAISFSRGSSWPRDRTWGFCLAGRGFTVWATRELTLHVKCRGN